MKCPHCGKDVALTWKRYWSSPLGKHDCPECTKPFRLKHSLVYYATIFSVAILLGLGFQLFRKLWDAPILLSGIIYLVLCIVILIPVDRWVDSKWRGTLKVKEEP